MWLRSNRRQLAAPMKSRFVWGLCILSTAGCIPEGLVQPTVWTSLRPTVMPYVLALELGGTPKTFRVVLTRNLCKQQGWLPFSSVHWVLTVSPDPWENPNKWNHNCNTPLNPDVDLFDPPKVWVKDPVSLFQAQAWDLSWRHPLQRRALPQGLLVYWGACRPRQG